MKPVDQTKFGRGAGNCLAACVASLLDLSIDEVFDIPLGGKDPDYWEIVAGWLKPRGLALVHMDVDPEKGIGPVVPWGMHYMAWGPSARGLEHSVIYCRGQLAHDPHPDRSGIQKVRALAFLARLT